MQDFKGAIQIAIAAFLLVIAGLLFSIYRKLDQQKPTAQVVSAPDAAAPGAQPVAAKTPDPAPPASIQTAKPSPTARKNTAVAKNEQPQPIPPTMANPSPNPSANPSMARDAPVPASAAAPPVQSMPDPAISATPGTAAFNAPPPPPPISRTYTIPAGTAFTVRLLDRIDSERNRTGDTFQCALDDVLSADGVVIARRGSMVVGRLVEAKQSGRVSGTAEVTLQVDRIMTIGGEQPIDTDVTRKDAPSQRGKDAAKVGILTGLGAAIGALAGHGKGAAIGAGAGAGAGTIDVLTTRGKPIKLEPETRLTFRLRSPLTITSDGISVNGFDNSPAQPTTDRADRPYLRRRNP